MITNEDLKAAIAECEGAKNPNANTCVKLAAFYTILNQRQAPQQVNEYSYASDPVYLPSYYSSETEFGQLVNEKGADNCLKVIDELMETIYVLNPSLYNGVIRKLKEL